MGAAKVVLMVMAFLPSMPGQQGVMGQWQVSMQEFTTRERCEVARKWLEGVWGSPELRRAPYFYTTCQLQ